MPETNDLTQPIADPPDPALKWLGWTLFLFTLFPAVKFVPLPIQTDTQPNALIVAGIVFLLGRRVHLPMIVWWLLVLFICATFLFVAEGVSLDGARSLIGYGTVFFLSVAVLVLAASGLRLPDRLLDVTVYIWGFVGAVQLFVWPSFLTFLVTASRTTETRGVAALSNEPSLYATMMIFFLILYFLRGRERGWPALFCLVQIVLFSQSALGIMFVLMMIGLYTMLRFSAATAMAILIALSAMLFVIVLNSDTLLAGTRVGGLIDMAINSPADMLRFDASLNSRIANIFYSLKGAIEDFLMPHGFNAWTAYTHTQDQIFYGILRNGDLVERIMSGYGAALFEMGISGMILPVVITVGIVRTFWNDSPKRALALMVVVHLLLLTPVTLALPLVGYLIGELLITSLPGQGTARVAHHLARTTISGPVMNRAEPIAGL